MDELEIQIILFLRHYGAFNKELDAIKNLLIEWGASTDIEVARQYDIEVENVNSLMQIPGRIRYYTAEEISYWPEYKVRDFMISEIPNNALYQEQLQRSNADSAMYEKWLQQKENELQQILSSGAIDTIIDDPAIETRKIVQKLSAFEVDKASKILINAILGWVLSEPSELIIADAKITAKKRYRPTWERKDEVSHAMSNLFMEFHNWTNRFRPEETYQK